MKKKMIGCLALSVASLLALTACGEAGGGKEGETGDAKKIVIYCGGSSEYSVVPGSEEDKVIDAVEDAYFKASGVKLDFEVHYYTTEMQGELGKSLAAHDQVDIAISHTRYGSGIDDYVIAQNAYYNLSDKIEAYGPNIIEKTDLSIMTTYEGDVVGIPSYVNPHKYGILVRKDYMEQVGYTDDVNKADTLIYLDTIEKFETMCEKMTEKGLTGSSAGAKHAISGAIWDVEKVFAGAFGNGGYFSYCEVKEDNEDPDKVTSVIPGYATQEYQDLLSMEYDWVKNKKILSSQANITTLAASEGEFMAGKTGVFLTDPTVTHLINVARRTKIVNPQAEFTVLGPLARTATPQKKGFMPASSGYKAAVVLKESKNAENIVKFLNWMYSDAKNYNLCKYGIEGEHWVNNGDGTYSYPAGKEDYLIRAPYSGIINLVDNENMSNLLFSGYTAEERSWINLSKKAENYVDNDVVNILLPRSESTMRAHTEATNIYYKQVANLAWTGQTDPMSAKEGMTLVEYYRRAYINDARTYTNFIMDYYEALKRERG